MPRIPSLVSTISFAAATLAATAPGAADPCAIIAGKSLVPPEQVLACLRSFPFNETIRQNVLANANGVLDFFTFEPYYLKSPKPFQESTTDIRKELRRMAKQKYASDYDFNIDLYNTTLRLNDGHTKWTPSCYISYQYLMPTPIISLLKNGKEDIYIIPELVEFLNALSPQLVDYLADRSFNWQRLAGAKVLAINGKPAYYYVDTVAREVSGNFLDHGIRVNSVFWSYKRFTSSFGQRFGELGAPALTTLRGLDFKVVVAKSTKPENVFVPYVASRLGAAFTDSASYWENNCAATDRTNGIDPYREDDTRAARRTKKEPMGFILETAGQKEAVGLDHLDPTMPPVSIGRKMSLAFFVLPNSTTGVMAVGDFLPANTYDFQAQAVAGVQTLLDAGVTSLIIDVHNNGGGFICLGQFLYAVLAGTNAGYPGFDSTHRANPMAQQIVKYYVENGITWMNYSPSYWAFPNNTRIPDEYNYNDPPETIRVNGVLNRNSQKFHDTCQQDWWNPDLPLPAEPPFPLDKVAVVSNGNCASTCAMFTTLLHERHKVKMVVFGGKPGEPIEYKGMAGNQVLEWRDIDTEIKTGKAKTLPGAPPDLIVSGNFRVNWRTAWSYVDKTMPIEYQSEPAIRFPYTEDTYSNPQNLWTFVAKRVLKVL
ncbi:hypothetical protein AURDEDRAFT_153882 [Auricularia subglabra TFB-10046 SS5]|nr:hypothetical protein AURDEDRAFT_153882 [Auricularia subglabra TFB-10046 SS5]